MDQGDDPRELERKIEQVTRIASRLNDQTTVERLWAWVEGLKQRLWHHREAARTREAISARAWEIWEHNGRPSGRDLEFWLQAESELNDHGKE